MTTYGMRNYLSYMIVACVLLSLAACRQQGSQGGGVPEGGESGDSSATRRLTLLFAGDLMQHITQINAARTVAGNYDYTSYFDQVGDYIRSFDVAVANLEVTLGGQPYTGYPQFSAPDAYLYSIRDAGFDVLATANNHCCDKGRLGIERTIRMLDSLGLQHVGTYVNPDTRSTTYPLLVEKNGFRLAFLNYTYGTNGIPVPTPTFVNLIDTAQISADMKKARSMRPDAIIALMHWGLEYVQVPTHEQRQLADWLLANGVTHVIGTHPHVVQPIESRIAPDGSRHVVAYSLGNFISNQWMENCDGGIMLALTLEKDTTIRLADCSYAMHWVSRPPVSGKKNHRIYPVASGTERVLNGTERRLMARFADNTRKLFERFNVGEVFEKPINKE